MKIKSILLFILITLIVFNTAHALQVVFVDQTDLLVYCTEGRIQATQYDNYIHVSCEPPKIYLPTIQK